MATRITITTFGIWTTEAMVKMRRRQDQGMTSEQRGTDLMGAMTNHWLPLTSRQVAFKIALDFIREPMGEGTWHMRGKGSHGPLALSHSPTWPSPCSREMRRDPGESLSSYAPSLRTGVGGKAEEASQRLVSAVPLTQGVGRATGVVEAPIQNRWTTMQ